MKKISLILSLLLFVGFTSLKAQNNPQQPKPGKYALVVSFISIGAGIDGASYDKIDAFIKNHPKKPAVITIQKGREGERMMYLELTELSKKEKKAFIKDIEKLGVNEKLVKFQKNFEVKVPENK